MPFKFGRIEKFWVPLEKNQINEWNNFLLASWNLYSLSLNFSCFHPLPMNMFSAPALGIALSSSQYSLVYFHERLPSGFSNANTRWHCKLPVHWFHCPPLSVKLPNLWITQLASSLTVHLRTNMDYLSAQNQSTSVLTRGTFLQITTSCKLSKPEGPVRRFQSIPHFELIGGEWNEVFSCRRSLRFLYVTWRVNRGLERRGSHPPKRITWPQTTIYGRRRIRKLVISIT